MISVIIEGEFTSARDNRCPSPETAEKGCRRETTQNRRFPGADGYGTESISRAILGSPQRRRRVGPETRYLRYLAASVRVKRAGDRSFDAMAKGASLLWTVAALCVGVEVEAFNLHPDGRNVYQSAKSQSAFGFSVAFHEIKLDTGSGYR